MCHFLNIKICNRSMHCCENQLAHSGKCKLKCSCPTAIFSKIHLPGQLKQVFMSVPVYALNLQLISMDSLSYLPTLIEIRLLTVDQGTEGTC